MNHRRGVQVERRRCEEAEHETRNTEGGSQMNADKRRSGVKKLRGSALISELMVTRSTNKNFAGDGKFD